MSGASAGRPPHAPGPHAAPGRPANGGSIQRKKNDASWYIRENDLGVAPRYEAIRDYVNDESKPTRSREQLLEAWNKNQSAHFTLAAPTGARFTVEKSFERAQALLDKVADLLPVPGKAYLTNRIETLRGNFGSKKAEYEKRQNHSGKYLAKLASWFRHPDNLPLLERSVQELEQHWVQTLTVPPNSTLLEKLSDIFQRATDKKLLVRFMHVSALIRNAPPTQRAAVAADDEFMAMARRLLAPPPQLVPPELPLTNDFPQFVTALGMREVGSVQPHDEADVDRAIRRRLGRWIQKQMREGVRVRGHVAVLKGSNIASVQSKYQANLPGMGQVNAFTEEGTIFLHANQGEPSTIVHEGIHLYAHGAFRKVFGGSLDEGVTEYFARQAAQTLGYNRDKYPAEHTAASQLIAILSEEAFARAYFEGQTDQVRSQFVRVRRLRGAREEDLGGEWETFLAHLRDKKWELARAMLQ